MECGFHPNDWWSDEWHHGEVITSDDVVPMLLEATSSFQSTWSAEMEHDPTHFNDDGTRLHYVDAGRFAQHLVDLFEVGQFREIKAAFTVIERLHVEGDPYVRELATIGYLEGIQNAAGNSRHVEATDFEPFLLPESRRWWDGLNRFWDGQTPDVSHADELPGSER